LIGLAWAPWFTAISVAALAIGALGSAMKKNNAIAPPNMGPLFFPGSGDGGYKEREKARKKAEQEAIARNKQLAKLIKDQGKAADELLKKKKLQNAIDKANLLLGKGEGVFDLDAIQYNAALINQAEQLGRITSSAQMLQIANDVARLNVKKSMYELEQAIQAGDIIAIEAAAAKLNKDLAILSVLTGQKATVYDIKSILDSLKPKELIEQSNLDEALKKIAEMLRLLSLAKIESETKPLLQAKYGPGYIPTDFIEPIAKDIAAQGSIEAIIEYAEAATERANAFAILLEGKNDYDELALNEFMNKLGLGSSASTSSMSSVAPIATAAAIQSGNRYAAQAANYYNITVNAGAVGSEETLVSAIQEGLLTLNRRGDSITTAGAL
jgi:hypothetical protein